MVCTNALNFRFYNLGEYDVKTVHIFNEIKEYYYTDFHCTSIPQNLRISHKGRGGSIVINEIPCIRTSNFILSLFYFPFMPYLSYMRVTIPPIENSSSIDPSTRTELFALAEKDGQVDENVTGDLKILERLFLRTVDRKYA